MESDKFKKRESTLRDIDMDACSKSFGKLEELCKKAEEIYDQRVDEWNKEQERLERKRRRMAKGKSRGESKSKSPSRGRE